MAVSIVYIHMNLWLIEFDNVAQLIECCNGIAGSISARDLKLHFRSCSLLGLVNNFHSIISIHNSDNTLHKKTQDITCIYQCQLNQSALAVPLQLFNFN